MNTPDRPTDRRKTVNAPAIKTLAALVEQHRRELSERLDVSPALRQLSRVVLPQSLLPGRRRRSPMLASFVVAAALALLLACVLGATGIAAGSFYLQGQLSDPTTSAQDFYAALHEQDYARAYSYLTPAAQQRTSSAAFVTTYSDLDAVAGVVESYTIGDASVTGTSATVVANVVRREDTTRAQAQTLTLAQQNGTWRIDRIIVGDSAPAPSQ